MSERRTSLVALVCRHPETGEPWHCHINPDGTVGELYSAAEQAAWNAAIRERNGKIAADVFNRALP